MPTQHPVPAAAGVQLRSGASDNDGQLSPLGADDGYEVNDEGKDIDNYYAWQR